VILVQSRTPANQAAISIQSQPIHLFLDLSLVERLLPVLRHTSKAIQNARIPSPLDSPRSKVKQDFDSVRPPFVTERSSSYVIDDLDAQATSVSTIRPSTRPCIEIACPLIRLDVRCPAPLARRGTWGDGAHLRSGIVTLDVHGLRISLGGDDTSPPSRRAVETKNVAAVTWDRAFLFFCRTPSEYSELYVGLTDGQVQKPRRSAPSDR
jgi:autophagy-related protein 2